MKKIRIAKEKNTNRSFKIFYKIKHILHPKKRRNNLIEDSWFYGYDYK